MEIKGVVRILIHGIRHKKQTLVLVYGENKISVEFHKRLSVADVAAIFRNLTIWLEHMAGIDVK